MQDFETHVKDVHTFAKWFLKNPTQLIAVPGTVKTIDVVGQDGMKNRTMHATLFRRDRFQAQMFCIPAWTIIPEHLHPRIRSYEVYVGGQISFSNGGKWVNHFGTGNIERDSVRTMYISEKTWHGGVFGPAGGIFVSLQEWLEGVPPTDVADDWEGVAFYGNHLEESPLINATEEIPTWRSAATKEDKPPAWWDENVRIS